MLIAAYLHLLVFFSCAPFWLEMYEQCKHMIKNIKKTSGQTIDGRVEGGVMKETKQLQVYAGDIALGCEPSPKHHWLDSTLILDQDADGFKRGDQFIPFEEDVQDPSFMNDGSGVWYFEPLRARDREDMAAMYKQLIHDLERGDVVFTVHGRPVRLVGDSVFVEIRTRRGRGFSHFTNEDLLSIKRN